MTCVGSLPAGRPTDCRFLPRQDAKRPAAAAASFAQDVLLKQPRALHEYPPALHVTAWREHPGPGSDAPRPDGWHYQGFCQQGSCSLCVCRGCELPSLAGPELNVDLHVLCRAQQPPTLAPRNAALTQGAYYEIDAVKVPVPSLAEVEGPMERYLLQRWMDAGPLPLVAWPLFLRRCFQARPLPGVGRTAIARLLDMHPMLTADGAKAYLRALALEPKGVAGGDGGARVSDLSMPNDPSGGARGFYVALRLADGCLTISAVMEAAETAVILHMPMQTAWLQEMEGRCPAPPGLGLLAQRAAARAGHLWPDLDSGTLARAFALESDAGAGAPWRSSADGEYSVCSALGMLRMNALGIHVHDAAHVSGLAGGVLEAPAGSNPHAVVAALVAGFRSAPSGNTLVWASTAASAKAYHDALVRMAVPDVTVRLGTGASSPPTLGPASQVLVVHGEPSTALRQRLYHRVVEEVAVEVRPTLPWRALTRWVVAVGAALEVQPSVRAKRIRQRVMPTIYATLRLEVLRQVTGEGHRMIAPQANASPAWVYGMRSVAYDHRLRQQGSWVGYWTVRLPVTRPPRLSLRVEAVVPAEAERPAIQALLALTPRVARDPGGNVAAWNQTYLEPALDGRRDLDLTKAGSALQRVFPSLVLPGSDDGQCSVCRDARSDSLMAQPCRHLFCTECIATWLAANDNCPLCRTLVKATFPPFVWDVPALPLAGHRELFVQAVANAARQPELRGARLVVTVPDDPADGREAWAGELVERLTVAFTPSSAASTVTVVTADQLATLSDLGESTHLWFYSLPPNLAHVVGLALNGAARGGSLEVRVFALDGTPAWTSATAELQALSAQEGPSWAGGPTPADQDDDALTIASDRCDSGLLPWGALVRADERAPADQPMLAGPTAGLVTGIWTTKPTRKARRAPRARQTHRFHGSWGERRSLCCNLQTNTLAGPARVRLGEKVGSMRERSSLRTAGTGEQT